MSKRRRNRRTAGQRSGVIATRPSWLLRVIALLIAMHGLYLISPWFELRGTVGSYVSSWSGGYMGSFNGRIVLAISQMAMAVLVWKLSTRKRVGEWGRWYHRWPFKGSNN